MVAFPDYEFRVLGLVQLAAVSILNDPPHVDVTSLGNLTDLFLRHLTRWVNFRTNRPISASVSVDYQKLGQRASKIMT